MTLPTTDLAEFGWNAFFNLELDPSDPSPLVRVTEVHRDRIRVVGPEIDIAISPYTEDPDDAETTATVGDWLALDPGSHRPRRLLKRRSLFKRRAAGTGREVQLIAANVDTLFIVSSCNQDFNLARLERYLVLAREAGVTPVVVLTKADLSDTPEDYVRAAEKLLPGLLVEMIDSRDAGMVACLAPWCARGQTVAMLGSSGVGKSTLANTLLGANQIATQDIREDDAKGRHTTTGRALHRLPAGGWLLDTPGMRELQLTDAKAGIEDVFADIVELARTCRFSDCGHASEPGCALVAAMDAGTLDPARVKRWRKLAAEDAYNSESLVERRARSKAFGKMAKQVIREQQSLWRDKT